VIIVKISQQINRNSSYDLNQASLPPTSLHPFPQIDADQAAMVFREKVFAMMREHKRISAGLMKRMRNWPLGVFRSQRGADT